MKKLSKLQIGFLVIAVGLGAVAIDYAIGRGGTVTSAGLGVRGDKSGFKGSDEELQTVRDPAPKK